MCFTLQLIIPLNFRNEVFRISASSTTHFLSGPVSSNFLGLTLGQYQVEPSCKVVHSYITLLWFQVFVFVLSCSGPNRWIDNTVVASLSLSPSPLPLFSGSNGALEGKKVSWFSALNSVETLHLRQRERKDTSHLHNQPVIK